MREPSYRVYRSNLNLPRMPNGSEHLIDDTDGRWADYIAAGWITPVGPPSDYEAPMQQIAGNALRFTPIVQPEGSALPDDWAPADPQPPNPPTGEAD